MKIGGERCWRPGAYPRRASLLVLEGTNCRTLVEIERKILIKKHGNIARTCFHFFGSPGRQGGLDRPAAFLQLRHHRIIASNFTQPRRAHFQVWRHFVAKPEKLAEVVGADGFWLNASRSAQ